MTAPLLLPQADAAAPEGAAGAIAALVPFAYLVAGALFILSLQWMSDVRKARRGNWAGAAGMILAVLATLGAVHAQSYHWIVLAVVAGAVAGVPMAVWMPMTAVPQRTALSHAFGALAAALVGTAEYYLHKDSMDHLTMGLLSAEVILGYLTFTGSLIAFAKLQEIMPGRPILYPGRNVVSLVTLGTAIFAGAFLAYDPGQSLLFPIMSGLALVFGTLLVIGIGGADMPTVIAILNSYAGLSAAAMGFVLNNKLLIVAGSLDGSSGFILAILMCKAMNRSFTNVLFGGVGAVVEKPGAAAAGPARSVQGYSIEDAATAFVGSRLVVVVPGYGMAVAQAQHAVRELMDLLEGQGVAVKFGIHPVAGRMPGHMNVLLAEANVPYERLLEMDEINPVFPETDIAIVVGANDVTNPAARTRTDSPLYGMPILDVDKSRRILFLKRSMNPGFAGVENELFYLDKTMMLFGDAKETLLKLVAALKNSA